MDSSIFTILFQASLDQGTVPDDWRTAFITPIFKKGDPYKPCNYRPASLASIPCKVGHTGAHRSIPVL